MAPFHSFALLRNLVLAASLVPIFIAPIVAAEKPNVLFIAVDDLNDWIGCMKGHPQTVTPNIDQLAYDGMLFMNAHCTAPLCNPSRASVMTGLLPSSNGVHGNQQDWRESPYLKDRPTIPQYFKKHGYWTGACGKIFHANHGGECGALNGGHGGLRGFNHPESWTERHPSKDRQLSKPAVMPGQNKNGLDIWHWDWGAIDVSDEATTDGQSVQWALEKLKQKHDKPFFLAVGIYRPHGPWYVPEYHFNKLEVENKIVRPLLGKNDMDDIPTIAKGYLNNPNNLHALIDRNKLHQSAVRAYLANITFADAMIGKVLDGLKNSPHAENTIVCLWSDHGWHLGEKMKWHKSTNWERATKVPLMIKAPNVTKPHSKTSQPVSLVDLFPTLVDLCALPKCEGLDGISLKPLLINTSHKLEREGVITTRAGKHHSVRTERWRYIRYSDGSEELYDHENDPNEWKNLARVAKYDAARKQLAALLPKDVKVVPAKPGDGGFRPLFNGYDLTGWEGDETLWKVENKTIIGLTSAVNPLPHNKFLLWKGGTSKDFELRLEARVVGNNSGIQYRSKRRPDLGEWAVSGYQMDIHPKAEYNGMLYEEKGRGIIAQRNQQVQLFPGGKKGKRVTTLLKQMDEIDPVFDPAKWHEYTVIARGNKLVHKIDGVTTMEVTDFDNEKRAMSGVIALQVHRGPVMKAEFRNIRYKEIGGGKIIPAPEK